MRYIIADAGSTKTDWATIVDGKVCERRAGSGINPSVMSEDEIRKAVVEVSQLFTDASPDAVHFYGAGCKAEVAHKVEKVISELAKPTHIYIYTDMLGAARSVLADSAGVVCILGTGSNSCLYDGCQIVGNIPPLGYILGDEGSGASLGSILVSEIIKGSLMHLKDHFFNEYNLNESAIIERVYRGSYPNRFLASFAPFLFKHRNDEMVNKLIVNEFKRFVERNVSHYSRTDLPVCFVGSVAWWFKDELTVAISESGYKLGTILQSPLEGLLAFHADKRS